MKSTEDYLAFIKEVEAAAYKKGYQAALEKVLKALGQPLTISEIPSSEDLSGQNPFKQGTDSAAVYEFVRNNMGLKGAEIIKKSGIAGKTVRTALHRLKVKGQVANTDGKWYIR
ncbi:MAG: hypothetical protein PHE27_04250 [Alphaproteobacteria bacterium]|nr:hypothetical protein [Alphaproteobacteria bacterium]